MFNRMVLIALVLSVMTVFGAPALAAEMGQDTQSPEVGLTEENLLKVIPDSYLNTADPDAVLSRGAFAAMLVKAAGIPESGMTENQGLPPDLATGEWYSGAVKALYEKNILQGFPDKKIYPEKPITGIEALALVARTLGLPEGVDAPIGELRDIAGDHWGYELYSWLVKEGLTLKDMDIFKPIGPGDAAKLLVKVFGTDREARGILEEANEKNKEIKSLRVKGEMTMKMDLVSGEGVTVPVETRSAFSGEFSKGTVHQVVEILIPGEQEPVKIEQYLDREYIYMLAPGKDGRPEWVRIKNPFPAAFDERLLSRQESLMKGFEGFVHYRLLGKETFEGEEYYKLAVYSRLDDMTGLSELMGSFGLQDKNALEAALGMLKSISMRGVIYMGVEDGLVSKARMAVTALMDPRKQQGSPAVINSMNMDVTYNYYDYNADIRIEIPGEAKSAEEIDATKP